MSVMTVSVDIDSADETTELSRKIWGRFARFESMVLRGDKKENGYFFYEGFEDFPCPATNTTGSSNGWRHFTSDGGTITDGAIANLYSIKATANDDNEAVVMAKTTAGVRITKNSQREVMYEARVRFDSITDTKNGAFFGLFEPLEPTATSHIGDDGVLTDKNFIGFHRLEGDGDAVDIVYRADGQTQQSFADSKVIAVDTWYKFGFRFDGLETLRFYINGVEYTTARLASANLVAVTFPSDINLSPAMVLHKAATGTTEGTNFVNWVAFGFTYADGDGYA